MSMNQSQQTRHDAIIKNLFELSFRGRLSPEDELATREARDLLNSYLGWIYDLERRVKEVESLIIPSQRFEAAKAAMQGLLASSNPSYPVSVSVIVENSIKLSDQFIARLQEKNHDT